MRVEAGALDFRDVRIMTNKLDVILAFILVSVVFLITAFGLTIYKQTSDRTFEYVDNGRVILTISDGDEPVGPCNLGDLVRAVRTIMPIGSEYKIVISSDLSTLREEHARCEPVERK